MGGQDGGPFFSAGKLQEFKGIFRIAAAGINRQVGVAPHGGPRFHALRQGKRRRVPAAANGPGGFQVLKDLYGPVTIYHHADTTVQEGFVARGVDLDVYKRQTQYSDSQPAGKQKIICYDVTVSAPYMEDLVKVFNAQSSTTEVEMRYLEDSEYEDRLNKLLEEGGQADVIWLRQPSKSNRMAEAGQLFDLSRLVGGSALDISKYGQSLDCLLYTSVKL